MFITGPMQAAFVMNKLVHPESVIVSQANVVAIEGGKLKASTRTKNVMKA